MHYEVKYYYKTGKNTINQTFDFCCLLNFKFKYKNKWEHLNLYLKHFKVINVMFG